MGARGYYILFSLGLAFAAAFWGGTLLKESADARDGLINVFAILAGVLVAVISIVGDPSMLLPGNWRVGYEHAKDMQQKIANFSHLFAIYIVSLLLLVTCAVIADAKTEHFDFVFRFLNFFVTLAILLSVPLPYSLMAIQKERMEEEIKSRKKRASD